MRYPMCSVSFILGPGCLWTTFRDAFAPRQLPLSVLLLFSFVVFQPIPSLRLIYRSFILTYFKLKSYNNFVKYTPQKKKKKKKAI
jgi:hypothetical protein